MRSAVGAVGEPCKASGQRQAAREVRFSSTKRRIMFEAMHVRTLRGRHSRETFCAGSSLRADLRCVTLPLSVIRELESH